LKEAKLPTIDKAIRVDRVLKADIDQIIQIADEGNLSFWSKDDYFCEIERTDSYIKAARIGERIVGFIAARFNIPITNEETDSVASEADVLNIGVLKSFQKQGIGQMLLKELLLEAERLKIPSIWLEVRESNLNAQTFYKRNEFIEIQKRKSFYSNPAEDAVLMRLDVNKLIKKAKK
jgi:ribosomal-protein-alanine N-acetyltransferase